jgi:hypothetical protein
VLSELEQQLTNGCSEKKILLFSNKVAPSQMSNWQTWNPFETSVPQPLFTPSRSISRTAPTSPVPQESTWYNYDRQTNQDMFGTQSLDIHRGWWPAATYQGYIRAEPAVWPKFYNPPFSNPARSELDNKHCGPALPCPWGGENNEGIVVQQYGRPVRVGMCRRGKCHCPLGQDENRFCAGECVRNMFGDCIWPHSEFAGPVNDPWYLNNFEFRNRDL